jgi:hypothetical protein
VVKEGAIYIALNFHVNPYTKSKILVEELTEYRYKTKKKRFIGCQYSVSNLKVASLIFLVTICSAPL